MANRKVYRDFGLVFAQEWTDARSGRDTIGEPPQANNLEQREYAALIKAADVRRIKFHGLRHHADNRIMPTALGDDQVAVEIARFQTRRSA